MTNVAAASCAVCGAQALRPVEAKITEKKRVKFGLFWVILTLLTCGLTIIVWLVMPRKNVVIGVDRFMQCSACGARQ